MPRKVPCRAAHPPTTGKTWFQGLFIREGQIYVLSCPGARSSPTAMNLNSMSFQSTYLYTYSTSNLQRTPHSLLPWVWHWGFLQIYPTLSEEGMVYPSSPSALSPFKSFTTPCSLCISCKVVWHGHQTLDSLKYQPAYNESIVLFLLCKLASW